MINIKTDKRYADLSKTGIQKLLMCALSQDGKHKIDDAVVYFTEVSFKDNGDIQIGFKSNSNIELTISVNNIEFLEDWLYYGKWKDLWRTHGRRFKW